MELACKDAIRGEVHPSPFPYSRKREGLKLARKRHRKARYSKAHSWSMIDEIDNLAMTRKEVAAVMGRNKMPALRRKQEFKGVNFPLERGLVHRRLRGSSWRG